MAETQQHLAPASLHWHDDGELSGQDLFHLVCRLKAVEPGHHSNELWRLGQKYPGRQELRESGRPITGIELGI